MNEVLTIQDIKKAMDLIKETDESPCKCNLKNYDTWYCRKHDKLFISKILIQKGMQILAR